MANRAIQAKVERAITQRRVAGNAEYLKSDYISAPKITSAEVARLVAAAPLVHVVTCPPGYATSTWRKHAGCCERRLWIGKPPRI
jgi:hypothetical protein